MDVMFHLAWRFKGEKKMISHGQFEMAFCRVVRACYAQNHPMSHHVYYPTETALSEQSRKREKVS
jgi:hypothetical protein